MIILNETDASVFRERLYCLKRSLTNKLKNTTSEIQNRRVLAPNAEDIMDHLEVLGYLDMLINSKPDDKSTIPLIGGILDSLTSDGHTPEDYLIETELKLKANKIITSMVMETLTNEGTTRKLYVEKDSFVIDQINLIASETILRLHFDDTLKQERAGMNIRSYTNKSYMEDREVLLEVITSKKVIIYTDKKMFNFINKLEDLLTNINAAIKILTVGNNKPIFADLSVSYYIDYEMARKINAAVEACNVNFENISRRKSRA